MAKQDIATRFWSKVEKTDGCWLWTGSVNDCGYGTIRINGKTKKAHRVVYELTHGEIPNGLVICHHCDKPACVRPDHLFAGTMADNMADMRMKGRAHPPTPVRGEKNNFAKLTCETADNIQREYAQGGISYRKLAERYGVSTYAVYAIIKGINWKAALAAYYTTRPAFSGKPGNTLGGKAERRQGKAQLVKRASGK